MASEAKMNLSTTRTALVIINLSCVANRLLGLFLFSLFVSWACIDDPKAAARLLVADLTKGFVVMKFPSMMTSRQHRGLFRT